MVYSKHPPKSRKYKKNQATKNHKSDYYEKIDIDEEAPLPIEAEAERSKKSPPLFGFLNSIFGNSDTCDKKSGKPIFNIMDHDIYFDDLLLAGLIILLLTDKMEDELLLIILLYLLADIF